MKHAMYTISTYLGLVLFLASTSGCATPTKPQKRPLVLIVESSQSIRFVEPNEHVVAPWAGVMIPRGRYLELLRLDMAVQSGDLVKREDCK